MTIIGCKWLDMTEVASTGCKGLLMPVNAFKWLEMDGNGWSGWNWLEDAGNGVKLREMAGMAGKTENS